MIKNHIETDGFLASNMPEVIADVRAKFKPWFDLVEDINRLGMRWMHEFVAPSINSNQQFIVATMTLRGMQTFQAAVILAERGMIADARSQARIGAETAIAVGALFNDESFIDRLVADHYRHKRKVANALLAETGIVPTLPPELQQMLDIAIAEVKQRYGEAMPPGINWQSEALKAGMMQLYVMVYRGTSGDSVHATALSLNRHVAANAAGNIMSLVFGPQTKDLDKALSAATSAILHAIQVIPKLFPTAPEAQLAPLVSRFGALVDGSNAG